METQLPHHPRGFMKVIILRTNTVFTFLSCLLIAFIAGAKTPESYTNDLGMKFVYIPAGKFMMGSPPDEIGRNSDEHLHLVELTKSFYLQTTEVTQAQWLKVMKSHRSPYKVRQPGPPGCTPPRRKLRTFAPTA